MILFKAVVQMGIGPMSNLFAQFAPNRRGVGVVTIACDPVRDSTGHRFGGPKERLGGDEITPLAQHHVHQIPVAIYGAMQIAPAAAELGIGWMLGLPVLPVNGRRLAAALLLLFGAALMR
jgi:hypothetical protein